MAWKVELARSAQKDLRRIAGVDAARIIEFFEVRLEASADSRSLGIAMQGPKYDGHIRYRVGDYRIIARIEDETLTILVVRVGHRRKVYR